MYSSTTLTVGFNGRNWLPPLLRSIRPCLSRSDQVVLVDNGGNEGVFADLDLEAELCIVATPTRMGFCDANNYGLSTCQITTDLVCFLNQDVVVDPEWFNPIRHLFESFDEIGALSPVHMTYDFARLNPNFRDSIRHDRRCMSRRVNDQGWFQQDDLIAAAMVVRTSVLAEIGGFDPIFGSYCEDYDLCRRIREAGYQTGVVPSSKIGHFDGSATRTRQAELKREIQVLRNWAILRIRSSSNRFLATMTELGWGLPKRFGRALLKRSGSHSPLSVIRAWLSLFFLTPRLISKRNDERISLVEVQKIRENLAYQYKSQDAGSVK